jgi:hypothetical protein
MYDSRDFDPLSVCFNYQLRMLLTPDLETKLALSNEAVQIQVCSDYNFHSEEQFKVNYWTKVLLTLSNHSGNNFSAISPLSLKQWWTQRVAQRSLPGLRKVLFVALEDSKDLILLSTIRAKYNVFFGSENFTNNNPNPSLVGRVARSLWRIAFGGEDDDSHKQIDESEIILSREVVKKLSKLVFEKLHKNSSPGVLETILVSESEVSKAIPSPSSENADIPFVHLSPQIQSMIMITCLIEFWKCVPFTVNGFNCLKLPPPMEELSEPVSPVSERDKAYIVSAIANEKLSNQESSLTTQWNAIDAKLREHLQAGRKPLALAALKERKLVEQRLEEIQIYKLKLAESTSVTQTAVIQQAVIEAISVGNKATKATLTCEMNEDFEEILEHAQELRNEVTLISQSIATDVDMDDAVLLEYEELVKQNAETNHAKQIDLIDAIPSPPTELPSEPIHENPKPQPAIVPEEWFSDIQ